MAWISIPIHKEPLMTELYISHPIWFPIYFHAPLCGHLNRIRTAVSSKQVRDLESSRFDWVNRLFSPSTPLCHWLLCPNINSPLGAIFVCTDSRHPLAWGGLRRFFVWSSRILWVSTVYFDFRYFSFYKCTALVSVVTVIARQGAMRDAVASKKSECVIPKSCRTTSSVKVFHSLWKGLTTIVENLNILPL